MHRRVDVAFVVDTTGSMGVFIRDAQRQMGSMLDRICAVADVDVRCVLIDYRDHPPQDGSYPAKLQTGRTPVARHEFLTHLNRLSLGGGGDLPEAVDDGLDMLGDVKWRQHSRRLAFLVGDAPPHGAAKAQGVRLVDGFPDGCPCGKTTESVTARLEDLGITLFGVCVSHDRVAQKSFGEYCTYTGGKMVSGHGMSEIEEQLRVEFGRLDMDKMVLDRVNSDPEWTVHGIASDLGFTEGDVDSSVRRLLSRDLVAAPAV